MTELPACRRHRRLTPRLATLATPRVRGPTRMKTMSFCGCFCPDELSVCVSVWLLYFQMTINYARKSQQMIAHTLRNICKFAMPGPTSLCRVRLFFSHVTKYLLDELKNNYKHWLSARGFLVAHNWLIIMPACVWLGTYHPYYQHVYSSCHPARPALLTPLSAFYDNYRGLGSTSIIGYEVEVLKCTLKISIVKTRVVIKARMP